MDYFTQIKDALKYIDEHLDEKMSLEMLAERFCFSTFYFHRLFSSVVGKSLAACSPTEYRKSGYQPVIVTVDELIIKFTNRLKGGTLINPKLIKHEKLILAGIQGAGNKTGEVWQNFLKLYKEKPLSNLL